MFKYKIIKIKARCLLVVVLVFSVFPLSLSAQTWSEWFKQKKTQKRYLLEQIAALKVYAGYLKKGYEIVDGGLSTVRDITKGEFSLHNAFISSLKQVSPVIRNDARVAEIIALQIGILAGFGDVKGSEYLSAEDQAYIRLVQGAVTLDCFNDLEELLLVVTSGRLEMKDDERFKRLDVVYENMLDKFSFVQDFCGNVAGLIRQRRVGGQEIGDMLRMFQFRE
ncbi:hypothetical protein SAMN04487898_12294 [Pedobacter sp. ok626]|uniref:hypothetical protein n=1 Tax=Pedobacter sp. ok626 TaxID=1761882 RepID=UPI00088C73A1|nr:hypothetical protein [Pedobacter sp. ok626]SDL67767.1 hypothetical protein SAMN04487898_12294 [Pedobacter sp. ok626]